MKLFSLLFLTLLLGKGCDDQKQDLDSALIVYSANTRGFYQKITIQKQLYSVLKERNGNEIPPSDKISDADWKELIAAFQEINLDAIAKLKAPTEQRFYDGAAIANLQITYKGKVYDTTDFDHGYPPAEIARLVTKINSLVKK